MNHNKRFFRRDLTISGLSLSLIVHLQIELMLDSHFRGQTWAFKPVIEHQNAGMLCKTLTVRFLATNLVV